MLKPKWNEVQEQREEVVQGEVKNQKFNYMLEVWNKFSNAAKLNPGKLKPQE